MLRSSRSSDLEALVGCLQTPFYILYSYGHLLSKGGLCALVFTTFYSLCSDGIRFKFRIHSQAGAVPPLKGAPRRRRAGDVYTYFALPGHQTLKHWFGVFRHLSPPTPKQSVI